MEQIKDYLTKLSDVVIGNRNEENLSQNEKRENLVSSIKSYGKQTFSQLKDFCKYKNPLANLPVEEKIVMLVDIVNFSKANAREQVFNIYAFQQFLKTYIFSNKITFGESFNVTNFIPTGDGCYMLADLCSQEVLVDFAVSMVTGFQKLEDSDGNKLSLRASVIVGDCIPFMDISNHKNYIGDGMNEAERVLSGGRAILEQSYVAKGHSEDEAKLFSRNSLFFEKSSFSDLAPYAENSDCALFTFNDVEDKHGKKRDVVVFQGIKEK